MSELELVDQQASKGISRIEIREEIAKLEQAMLAHPDAIAGHMSLDLMHHFTPGIYMRTVLMKAGDLIVGQIHKREHLVVVSAGRARVVSEEFDSGAKELVAPYIFKSQPGVKRALLILEDMVFTTVHSNPTNTQDLAQLEAELIAKDYSEVAT